MWFRRKPERAPDEDQLAARYEPGEHLGDLLKVARETYPGNAQLGICPMPSGPLLVVRYTESFDAHPPRIAYIVVEPGSWLAYDPGEGFLYQATDAEWEQFYIRRE